MTTIFMSSVILSVLLLFFPGGVSAFQEEGTLRIGGMWALSGPAAYIGSSSNGLSSLAIDEINEAGGIAIKGKRVKLVKYAYDDACKAEEGLAVVRRLADSDKVLFSLGPTCSNVAEPVFGTLQKRLDDPNDSGLQFLFFTDTAIKFGLAKLSPWAFRNVGNEPAMFELTFQLVKEKYPDLKTVAVAYESDFAHSVSTWKGAVKPALEKFGYQVLDTVEWRFEDTEFGAQATKLRKANADILVMLSHTFSTCGSVKELKRQRVKAKLMVGITSTANTETMTACGQAVEGMIIPTNFAPITPKAKAIAEQAWTKYKADSNLHSVPAYENIYAIKGIVEKAGIDNEPDTLLSDRRKVRDALAKLGTFPGLIGPIKMNSDDDAVKPRDVDKAVILVQAKGGEWSVWWQPSEMEQP
jgi:branched-chain amino acid transport system substrate-binding protein